MLYPGKRLLHMKGEATCLYIYDDVYSRETWWNIQVIILFSREEIMKKNGLDKVQVHEYLISYITFTKNFSRMLSGL